MAQRRDFAVMGVSPRCELANLKSDETKNKILHLWRVVSRTVFGVKEAEANVCHTLEQALCDA